MLSFEESSFKISENEMGCLSGFLRFWIQSFWCWALEGQSVGLKGLRPPGEWLVSRIYRFLCLEGTLGAGLEASLE